MPCQEMNWKMPHRLQEEFIIPAEAGREEQLLGLGIIPKSAALEGLRLLCQEHSSGGTVFVGGQIHVPDSQHGPARGAGKEGGSGSPEKGCGGLRCTCRNYH